jgi:hypothetical protein
LRRRWRKSPWGRTPRIGGKNGNKRHALVEESGVPLSLIVSAANTHDSKKTGELLDARAVRPEDETTVENLCLEAGYVGKAEEVSARGYTPPIRPCGEEIAESERNPDSHDLGMAFDIEAISRDMNAGYTGISATGLIAAYITKRTTTQDIRRFQMNQANENAAPIDTQLSWPPGFTRGSWNDAAATWFVLPDTLTAGVRNANTSEGNDPAQPVDPGTNPAVYRLPTGMWAGVGGTQYENDQRALTAQILSFYSVTKEGSAGYTSARDHFSGSDVEKAEKAKYLLINQHEKSCIILRNMIQ